MHQDHTGRHEGTARGATGGPRGEATGGHEGGSRGDHMGPRGGRMGGPRGATRGHEGHKGRAHGARRGHGGHEWGPRGPQGATGEAMRGEVCLGTTDGSGRAEPGHTSCDSWSPAGGSQRAARVSEGCPRLRPGHSTGGKQIDAQRYLETCPPTTTFQLRAPGVRPRMLAGDADTHPPWTSSCSNFGQRWRWWLKIQESA